MLKIKEYTDDTSRDVIIASMGSAVLIEDKITFTGNFLIFEDGKLPLDERIITLEQVVSTYDPKIALINTLKTDLEALKTKVTAIEAKVPK